MKMNVLRWFTMLLLLSARETLFAHGDETHLKIIPGPLGKKLQIEGETGFEYLIQGSPDLGMPGAWRDLLKVPLNLSPWEWTDAESAAMPQRFYRVLKLLPAAGPERLSNFRLLDHQGKSRELQYYSNQRAVVLVFVDGPCSEVEKFVPALKAAQERFGTSNVLFWMVAPDAKLTRADLAARAATWGLGWPLLHDSNLLVARDFSVTSAPEVVAISTKDWTVFYQGAIDDRTGNSAPTQNHLATALAQFLANEPVSPKRTSINGCKLAFPPRPPVSYAKDVAPILKNRCVQCHSAGNIAPWEMKSYEVVKDYAALIKDEVLTGAMPPWHADPAHGKFINDGSLTPDETATVVQWINEGAPRGEGPDPLAELFAGQPPAPDYPSAWPAELGEPDYMLSLPRFTVQTSGEVDYQYQTVTVDIPTNVWLRAAVILPGNTRVVHHSLVFAGTILDVVLSGGGLGGYFAAYVPGMKPTTFPAGTAKLLPANSKLTFQMHYTPVGTEAVDETRLGLYFAKEPPRAELKTTAAATVSFAIPPRASDYEREKSVIPSETKDVLLYELSPHMHYRGSRFRFEAVYPNGTSEVILSVPKYDFHWQTLYRLAEPKRLPAGTRIRCVGAFDNSAQNPDNPNPNATVRFGEQTDDEMFIGYLNYSEID